jgi:hypothetical protein
MKTTRMAILAAMASAATLGLAAPASAELTDGTYELRYIVDPSPTPDTIVVTSCGAGCKYIQMTGPYTPSDYHLRGNTWTATSAEGSARTIDNNTLAGSAASNAYQLVKVG